MATRHNSFYPTLKGSVFDEIILSKGLLFTNIPTERYAFHKIGLSKGPLLPEMVVRRQYDVTQPVSVRRSCYSRLPRIPRLSGLLNNSLRVENAHACGKLSLPPGTNMRGTGIDAAGLRHPSLWAHNVKSTLFIASRWGYVRGSNYLSCNVRWPGWSGLGTCA